MINSLVRRYFLLSEQNIKRINKAMSREYIWTGEHRLFRPKNIFNNLTEGVNVNIFTSTVKKTRTQLSDSDY